MMTFLIILTIYLLCGIAFLIRCIVRNEGFDLSGGFVPNWIMYGSAVFLWWFCIGLLIRDR